MWRPLLSDLIEYAKDILGNWISLMSGLFGVVIGFIGAYAIEPSTTKFALSCVSALAIVCSPFLAWRKQRDFQRAAEFSINSAQEDAQRPRFSIFPTRLAGDELKNMAIKNIGPTSALELTLTLNGHDKGGVDILRPGETIDRQIPHNNDHGRFAFTFRTEFGSTWSITQSAYENETVIEVKRPYQV